MGESAAIRQRVRSLPVYLSGRCLQRVVVQDDGLQLGEAPVADGDGRHLVAGEVQAHQRKFCQFWTQTRFNHKNPAEPTGVQTAPAHLAAAGSGGSS